MRQRRVVATAVAVVVLVVGAAVLLWPQDGHRVAGPPPPSASLTATASPSPSPSKVLPYPFFVPGTCLDHPQLSETVTRAEARPCEGSHDGEAIADVVLPDGITSDAGIGRALRELCTAPVAEWRQRQGGDGPYYGFPLGPYLQYYQQGMHEATCTLTASDRQGGRKLTGHLR
ncbi:hypothetical protein OG871_11065 [Kitasatospora sp. NBC_00374]|uniref:hypothetical protein n=1 Tax=Kitasatospora sp. NBC_00374 TaxID=2975964 RepID=UPI0030E1FAF8